MDLLIALFNRRLASIKHRWIGELSLALLLPIGIYLTIGFGLLVNIPSMSKISKLAWLVPGVILMISFSGALLVVFNDVLRNRKLTGFYGVLYASPSTPTSMVMSITLSVFPEGIARSFLALIILQLLVGYSFPILGQLFMIVLILFSVVLGASAGLTLGILSRDAAASHLTVILLLLGLAFGSSWFLPIDVFPDSIGAVFRILPTTVLAKISRGILMGMEFSSLSILIPVGTVGLWSVLNVYLFPRISSE